MVFYLDYCEFHALESNALLATNRCIDGLYHLEFQPCSDDNTNGNNSILCAHPSINNVKSKNELNVLWHLCLGHVSNDVLHHIPEVRWTVATKNVQSAPCLNKLSYHFNPVIVVHIAFLE